MRSILRSILPVLVIGAVGATLAACGGEGGTEASDEEAPIVVEEGGPIALGDPGPGEDEIDVVEEPAPEPEPRVIERTVIRERPRAEPRREEPVREAPRPAPEPEPEPEPEPVTAIPSGTNVPVTVMVRLDSENHDVGDRWSGRVARDVVVRDRVVIPAGAAVSGVITAIDEGDRSGNGSMTLVARSIETAEGTRSVAAAPVSSGVMYEDKGFPTKETAIGAGAGAALGAIIGGKKGAAIGAGVGGAGGAVAGKQRNDQEVAIESGTTVTIRLEEDVPL